MKIPCHPSSDLFLCHSELAPLTTQSVRLLELFIISTRRQQHERQRYIVIFFPVICGTRFHLNARDGVNRFPASAEVFRFGQLDEGAGLNRRCNSIHAALPCYSWTLGVQSGINVVASTREEGVDGIVVTPNSMYGSRTH
jgi:hypothetical protein